MQFGYVFRDISWQIYKVGGCGGADIISAPTHLHIPKDRGGVMDNIAGCNSHFHRTALIQLQSPYIMDCVDR